MITGIEIRIESEDAAMVDDPKGEIFSALENIAEKIRCDHDCGVLFDTNGNLVGRWELLTNDEDDDPEGHEEDGPDEAQEWCSFDPEC